MLLTAGYDHRLNIIDVKSPDVAMKTKLSKDYGDLEMVAWHPNLEHNFACCTEGGYIVGFDIRKIQEPVFSFEAHKKAVSSLSFSPFIPNMMASSSLDGTVKVWDISAHGGTKPVEIGRRNMQ